MPNLRSPSRTGDLYAKVIIQVPKKLTKEQREKLVEFGKSCGDKDLSAEEGFMGKAKRFLKERIDRKTARKRCQGIFDFSLDEAVRFREDAKKSGKTFVLTNGCFDLLHYGHVSSLTEASKLGDCLWVAMNSDSSVRELKGNHRPIIPEAEQPACSPRSPAFQGLRF